MNHLKYLEFQKLIKEFQFIESNYIYESEIIRISDVEFLKSVNILLDSYPELKRIYEESKVPILETYDQEFEYPKTEIFPNIKKIYRNIVKSTHPDRVENNKLNNLYIEATEAYEQNDIITLYRVCSELNIEFELTDDFFQKIQEKINLFKQKTLFLEKTYAFRWIKSKTETEKNKVILEYIKNQLNYV
jgi:hypothetical protein